MQSPGTIRSRWVGALAIVAVVFGIATIISGGRTLLDAEVQRAAGNFVAFVLWFNFLAGIAYVVAGIGLWFGQRWSVWLSMAITAATILVFAVFGVQVMQGGSYEMRTVWAMVLRVLVWVVISMVAYAYLLHARARTTLQGGS